MLQVPAHLHLEASHVYRPDKINSTLFKDVDHPRTKPQKLTVTATLVPR